MSGFKKAMGVFWDFGDQPQKETPATSPKTSFAKPVSGGIPGFSSSQATPTFGVPTSAPPKPAVDLSKFHEHFADLFENSNLPGPDYHEYLKGQIPLKEHIKDEKTLFTTTLSIMQATHPTLTKKVLEDSATAYIQIFLKDRENFSNMLVSKQGDDVSQREKRIKELAIKIEQNSQAMEKIRKETEEATNEITKLTAEKEQAEAALNETREAYMFANEAAVNKIQGDLEKIKAYL